MRWGREAGRRTGGHPAGFSPVVKPATIALSGDSTNIVHSLTWPVWNAQTAVGHGIIDIQGRPPAEAWTLPVQAGQVESTSP